MRFPFVLTLISLLALNAQAQSPANDLVWMRYFEGNALSAPDLIGDLPGQVLIETDLAGHVIVAATYLNHGNEYTAYDDDTLFAHFNASEDIALMKLDADGALLWHALIEGPSPIRLMGFDTDASNNLVLYLQSNGEMGYQGQQFPAGRAVLKLDPDAGFLWHTSILGAGGPYYKMDMLCVDLYDRIVLAGTIGTVDGDSVIFFDPWSAAPDTIFYYNQLSDTLIVNGTAFAPPGERNLFFCRLDPSGNLDHQHQFAYPASDPISVTSMDASSGEVLIAGNTNGHHLILDGDTLNTDTAHVNRLCVLRFTDLGSLLWGRTYFGSPTHSVIGSDVLMSPGSNDAFVSGYFYESAEYNGSILVSAGVQDALLMKVDGTGNMLWAMPVGDAYTNQISFLAASQMGSIIISGFGVNQADLMHKYQSNGDPEWILPFTGAGNINSTNAEFNNFGDLFCAGTFDGEIEIGGASIGEQPFAGFHVFILKFRNQDISTGVPGGVPQHLSRPSPNPGRDQFNLPIPGGPYGLRLIDATGRLVLDERVIGVMISVNTSSLATGLFTFQVRDIHGRSIAVGRWMKE